MGEPGQVQRGYFALGDVDHVVRVSSSGDFLLSIWAINVDTFAGGVQVLTPPSQFRTVASSGPGDGLVLDVPAQTSLSFSPIGGKGGETFDISSGGNARITVYLTLVTEADAVVAMVAG